VERPVGETIAGSGRAMSLCCMKSAGHTGVKGFRDAMPECAECRGSS
jgi:hypothetical protein